MLGSVTIKMIIDIVFIIFMLFQVYDLFGMAWYLIFSHKLGIKISPIHRLVFRFKEKYSSERIRIETDGDATLAYFYVFFFTSITVLILYKCVNVVSTMIYGELFILQVVIYILLIDSLLWVSRSTEMLFSHFSMRLDALSLLLGNGTRKADIINHTQVRLGELDSTIKKINPLAIVPYFLLRVGLVIVLFTVVYIVIYKEISFLEPNSFIDGSGLQVLSVESLIYYSVMLTTGIGSDIAAKTPLARFFVQMHGLTTLFIFALLIALFTTVASENIELRKSVALEKLQKLRKKMSRSG